MKRSSIRRRRPTPRRSSRVRDTSYLLFVKTLPCAARDIGLDTAYPCFGEVEADHAGRRPMGRKADDATTIPLCQQHHHDRGSFSGAFKTFNQAGMRAWLAEAIEQTQAMWRAHQGRAA